VTRIAEATGVKLPGGVICPTTYRQPVKHVPS
jgi:hypothetical protein